MIGHITDFIPKFEVIFFTEPEIGFKVVFIDDNRSFATSCLATDFLSFFMVGFLFWCVFRTYFARGVNVREYFENLYLNVQARLETSYKCYSNIT